MLGVKIGDEPLSRLRLLLEQFLRNDHGSQIVTVNPEMLLEAYRNDEFRQLLNKAAYTTADGIGIRYFSFGKVKNRITGNDLIKELVKLSLSHSRTICLLGGAGANAEKAASKLQLAFPQLSIHGESGGKIHYGEDWEMDAELLHRIRSLRPAILLVGLGHGKQEFWIRDHLQKLPSVRIAVGVGGSIDFLAGSVKRAPRLMQRMGLEWLYRVIQEPRRIGRIGNAVIVFPILVIFDKLKRL